MWTHPRKVSSRQIRLHLLRLSGSHHPRIPELSTRATRLHKRSLTLRSRIGRCHQADDRLSNHQRRTRPERATWHSAQEGTQYAKDLSLDKTRWTHKASQRKISLNSARAYPRRTSINNNIYSHLRFKSPRAKSIATAWIARSIKPTKTSSPPSRKTSTPTNLNSIKTPRPSPLLRHPIPTPTWPATTKRLKE